MSQDVRHREYRMKSADANLHSLQTRKICFSRKNKTVSVSKVQFYFWVYFGT